jgi:hypothetical protein
MQARRVDPGPDSRMEATRPAEAGEENRVDSPDRL